MSLIASLLLQSALAADPVNLTVAVVDAADKPIPTATIRFPVEGEDHRVNAETARWTADSLVGPSGEKAVFKKRDVVQFEVEADGYTPVKVAYAFRKKKNEVRVVLER